MVILIFLLISSFAAVLIAARLLRGMRFMEKTRFHKGVKWFLAGVILLCVTSSVVSLTSYCSNSLKLNKQKESDVASEIERLGSKAGNDVNIPKMTNDRDMGGFSGKYTEAREWEKLSEEDKLDLLSIVADTENEYLHISEDFKIVSDVLDEEVLGTYIIGDNEIVISKKCLNHCTLEENINTVCHEAFHAFQQELVYAYKKGYIDDSVVETHDLEFDDYVNGTEDYKGYYDQKCEQDARSYAKEAARLYMQEVM